MFLPEWVLWCPVYKFLKLKTESRSNLFSGRVDLEKDQEEGQRVDHGEKVDGAVWEEQVDFPYFIVGSWVGFTLTLPYDGPDVKGEDIRYVINQGEVEDTRENALSVYANPPIKLAINYPLIL